MITTGEGGVAMTNRAELADKMARLRSHGITRDPALMTHSPDGSWYYQQLELGFNYRMTDIQAALGLSQLQRLDQFIAKRRDIAAQYRQQLQGLPLTWQQVGDDFSSSWHLFVIEVLAGRAQRDSLFNHLRKSDIGVNLHYIPLYHQPYYQQAVVEYSSFNAAECYYQRALSLPLFPELTDAAQQVVIKQIYESCPDDQNRES